MLFIILRTDIKDGAALRAKHQDAHRAYIGAAADRLLAAGPTFEDDGETPNGGLLIMEARNLDEVRAFCDADPYQTGGVFADTVIRPYVKALPRD